MSSLGGYNPNQLPFTTSFEGLTFVTWSVSYVVKAIRYKQTHLDIIVDLSNYSTISTGNDNFEVFFVLNPTFAWASLTFNDVTNSALQLADWAWWWVGATTVTGWHVLGGAYRLQSNSIDDIANTAIRLGSAIDGTSDVIAMCIRPLSNNAVFSGSFTWEEAI